LRSNDKPDQSKVFKNSAAIEKLLERIDNHEQNISSTRMESIMKRYEWYQLKDAAV